MALDITTTLSNSLRVQYVENYIQGGERRRFYDQVAQPIDERSEAAGRAQSMADLKKGGTVQVVFLSDMSMTTTPLSEVADIAPQTLKDATATVTVDMFGDAIQVAEKAMIQRYTDYGARMADKVGLNMMELVDFKAMEKALAGSLSYCYATRATLAGGTTAHRMTDTILWNIASRLSQFNVPGWEGENRPANWAALTDHFVLSDLVTNSTGNILNVAQYQQGDLILNQEIGKLGPFKLLASGWAKILFGAGTVGGSGGSTVATSITTAVNALAKTMVVTSDSDIAANMWLNVCDTVESSTTFYPHNERVKVVSYSGGTVVFVGGADNGGLRFAHAVGTTVSNNFSAHQVLVAGPASLAKVYAPEIGEYGQLVGPLKQGLAQQWSSLAWKWYGGYGRLSENWLYRAEVAVSEEV